MKINIHCFVSLRPHKFFTIITEIFVVYFYKSEPCSLETLHIVTDRL